MDAERPRFFLLFWGVGEWFPDFGVPDVFYVNLDLFPSSSYLLFIVFPMCSQYHYRISHIISFAKGSIVTYNK